MGRALIQYNPFGVWEYGEFTGKDTCRGYITISFLSLFPDIWLLAARIKLPLILTTTPLEGYMGVAPIPPPPEDQLIADVHPAPFVRYFYLPLSLLATHVPHSSSGSRSFSPV